MKTHQKRNKRILFVWPWMGVNNERISFYSLISRKKFTLAYLITIWSLVGVLGFASTVDCESIWQYAFYCDYAFWIKNLVESPFFFFRNLFTTPFIHNGIDHILFVSVLGFFLIVQSHEVLFGSKQTALIFFSSYFTVAPFFAIIYNIGIEFYPDNEFLNHVVGRSWVGGSIGMFQVYGSLAVRSKKSWIMLMIPVLFEMFNLFVIEIHPQISIMHLSSVFCGFALSYYFIKKQ